MTKATPRPWLLNAHHERIIVDANHRTLADMTGPSNEIAERTANARLVIEAVNAYEALQARIRELTEALEHAAEWCAIERDKLGAVDGYDYRSGEEYGLRRAEIEFRRRAALAPKSPTLPPREREGT